MADFTLLKQFLDSLPEKHDLSCVDCGVYHHGKEIFRHSCGYADKESKTPLTQDHLFYLYSATKVITCAAGMRAIELGLFLPGDPVYWYIPEFTHAVYKHKNADGSVELRPVEKYMSIQDLFSMSSGLNYDMHTDTMKAAIAKYEGAPTVKIMRELATQPLDFTPGSTYQYSFSHDMLAAVIEITSGMRFADFVKKHILNPLEMHDTVFHPTPETEKRMATQYIFDHETGKERIFNQFPTYIFGELYDSGGAGLISNVNDYSKFARAMANGGVGINGNRILSRAAIDLMRTNIFSGKRLERYQSEMKNMCYGYGFGVRTKLGVGGSGNLAPDGEFGWDGAAGFFVSIDPSKNLSIVCGMHERNPRGYLFHNRIRNFVHAEIQ